MRAMRTDTVPFSDAPTASRRPRIVVVGTGGTIAGAAGDAAQTTGYAAGALPIQQLLAAVPMLGRLAEVEAEQVAALDSKDMDHTTWLALARRVQHHVDRADVDGIVVTHGTDTLEETAYWLNLTIATRKPVVFTAAMRPATALSADGPLNLLDAVTVAVSPSASGKGVLIAFGHRIFGARDIAKTSSYAVDAFSSGERGVLGWVQDGRVDALRDAEKRHTVNSAYAPLRADWDASALARVEIVSSYAGVTGLQVEAAIAAGVPGIVVAGTGGGSIHQALLRPLLKAAEAGVVIVQSSRISHPRVTGDALDAHFIPSGTLSVWKARVLLTVALTAHPADPQACRDAFAHY